MQDGGGIPALSRIRYYYMICRTGLVDSFNVSLSTSFFSRKEKSFFLMKLELSKTLKLSTNPVTPTNLVILSPLNVTAVPLLCFTKTKEKFVSRPSHVIV